MACYLHHGATTSKKDVVCLGSHIKNAMNATTSNHVASRACLEPLSISDLLICSDDRVGDTAFQSEGGNGSRCGMMPAKCFRGVDDDWQWPGHKT